MDWKYFFAHTWPAEDRTCWEDVYLMPADQAHQSESYCLTVDAVGAEGSPCYSAEENAAAQEKLRDCPYHFDSERMKMIVRCSDFSQEEMLNWTRVCLEDSGYTIDRLMEGTYDDFEGTNWHSRIVKRIKQR